MAITQTGSTLQFQITSTASTGTVSSSIAVPDDAQLIVVGVSGYMGAGRPFASMSFTQSGSPVEMVKATGGDAENDWSVALHYLILTDTSDGQTLAWDWEFSNLDSSLNFAVTFWTGIDISGTPVRDSNGGQSTTAPVDTPTLTASSGDLIVAVCGGYSGSEDGILDSYSNLTELTELTRNTHAVAAMATGAPSGDTTVGIVSATNVTNLAISAIVLTPTAPDVTVSVSGVEAQGRVGSVAGAMTIEQVGSVLQYDIDVNYAHWQITGISVPADADFVIVGVSGYMGDLKTFAAMTFTKGGVDAPMTRGLKGDVEDSWMSAMFWQSLPDKTGDPGYTTSTLKWHWSHDSVGIWHNLSITFWKGVKTTGVAVRDSDGEQASSLPINTPTLTASSGDLIVAFAGIYNEAWDGSASITAWSNLTELAEIPHNEGAEAAWATFYPAADTTVGIVSATNAAQFALTALVLKPGNLGDMLVSSGAGLTATGSVGQVTLPADVTDAFGLETGPLYRVTTRLGASDVAILDTTAPFADAAPDGYAEWYTAGFAYADVTGVSATGSIGQVTVVAESAEIPGTPIIGTGGSVPKKQMRRAVRELLERQEKRKGRKKPKVLAREILEVLEAKGLGAQEKRLAERLIGEALRLELPSLFYSQPIIRDKGEIARAILFLVQQAMQRIADEEEDEEAALLLLSAA